jgi:hypothetical protein
MSTKDLVGKKLAISVMFDVVGVEIHCGDEYEAQVLYDDLIERMRSGEGFSLGAKPKEKSGT